jgi:hypothetical protein
MTTRVTKITMPGETTRTTNQSSMIDAIGTEDTTEPFGTNGQVGRIVAGAQLTILHINNRE